MSGESPRTIELPAGLPYDPFRTSLYTRGELMAGWPDATLDGRIERHVLDHGFRSPPAAEALAQRLHDHAIDVALSELLCAEPRWRVVGVMGSAATPRTDPWYRRVAELTRALARADYLVASGGGPGLMEAANLGAFLARHDDEALDEALATLAREPDYERDPRPYVEAAAEVRERFEPGGPSLAIPTWFYPGEPVGQFASHIAKYFANSIREDGLLAIAVSGVVFAPGRAGTLQELFQDAAQNAYGIRGQSPMVLFGADFYARDPSIHAVLRDAARRFGAFESLVGLADDVDGVLAFLDEHQPAEAAAMLHECEPAEALAFLRNERNRAR
jgi:predicted Rossmann-fold nucleotide-binding protein